MRIPVIASGRINDPRLAEKILQDGDADFISMGRPLLADPGLPNKAREGRLKDICSCIACNEGCNGRLYAGLDVSCVVNPRVGRETLFPSTPAELSRRVLVAGGGPGGMMAAVTAAKRGHRVTLCEASPSLGGQLLMGCLPPHKEEIRTLVEYLVGQVMKSGVELRLESVVSQSLIREIAPDAVILATGATPVRPSIPAADGRVVTAWDVLARRMTVGKRVLIVGGGEVGCELAELLAGLGKEVVIIEILPEVATNMEPRGRRLLLERLHALGVQLLTQSSVSSVGERAVFYDQGGLRHRMDRVDTVVTAVGSAANNPLQHAVEGIGILVHSIGDCVKPRRILEAVREGFEAAYAI